MAGGLEKNIILLANYLAVKQHEVKIITFDFPEAESFYHMHKNIKWHRIGDTPAHAKISFAARLKLMLKFRNHVKCSSKPIIICFHHGILARVFLSTLFIKKIIICSERNSLSIYNHIQQTKWNINYFLLNFVSKIIVQFNEYVKDYPFWMVRKITVISNPVMKTSIQAKPNIKTKSDRLILLTVGRLCTQKQQNVLIDSFIISSKNNKRWDLHIIGDGGGMEELQAKIDLSGLHNRIFLNGKSDCVSDWYGQAQLFCMASQWEGFPNALAEAMAHGLPSVGFAECAGVREMIEDGVTGRLVKGIASVNALSDALTELMQDTTKRVHYGKAAKKAMLDYMPENVFSKWDKILAECQP
jgi:glycosyltransferase involved in cell wall biosynthesis